MMQKWLVRQVVRHLPIKNPGLVRRKLEGTHRRWCPCLAGRGTTSCWATRAAPSYSCWPQFWSQNSGEPFGLAWLFWALKQRCVLFLLLVAEEKSRANQDPPSKPRRDTAWSLGWIRLFLLDIQPTQDRDSGKMLAIRKRLLVDIKESVHRSPQ